MYVFKRYFYFIDHSMRPLKYMLVIYFGIFQIRNISVRNFFYVFVEDIFTISKHDGKYLENCSLRFQLCMIMYYYPKK